MKKIGRPQRVPLYEKHFAPEMWEKVREDGKKKLKANAIPTIFLKTYAHRYRISGCSEQTVTTNNINALLANKEMPVDEHMPFIVIITNNIDAPPIKEFNNKIAEDEKDSNNEEIIKEQLKIIISEKKPYEEL